MNREVQPSPPQGVSPGPAPWYRALGPGVVFALTSIGPGDFVSNTAAGAVYGYSALWILALSLLLRYVWLDTAGRYVILRQESLMSGFSRKGPWVLYAVLGSLLLEGHLRNLFKYTLMGACLHLVLPLPTPYSSLIWAAFSYLFGFWMMFFRGYPTVEIVFKVLMGLMGGALVILSALTPHDPARVFQDLLHPVLPEGGQGLERFVVIVALLGTSAGATTNLVYSYFVEAKGWTNSSYLRWQRSDLLVSIGFTFLVGALLQTVAASSFSGSAVVLDSPSDLMALFTQEFGLLGRILFALGLWAAAFTGYVGTTTGFAMVFSDIWVNHLSRGSSFPAEVTRRRVYRALVLFWCVSTLYVLFTGWRPIFLVLVVNAAVVLLIPVLTFVLLRLTGDPAIMGDQKNSRITNFLLWLLIVISLFCIYQAFFLG